MILYRCFAWSRKARPREPDGALWFPRPFQGEGRHDNPELYGCLYLADRAVSGVVEQLAQFRGQRILPSMLVRRGLPLGLAEIELPDDAGVVDLDDPRTLVRERLRPSEVATRRRETTRPLALGLFRRHEQAAALRWWSTYEAEWANYTVFDRAGSRLRLLGARALAPEDAEVREAAELLGLREGA